MLAIYERAYQAQSLGIFPYFDQRVNYQFFFA